MNFYCSLTCDIEIKKEDDFGDLIDILNLLEKHDVDATFFLELVGSNFDILKDENISQVLKNHEVGLHIHWGNMLSHQLGVNALSIADLENELKTSLKRAKELKLKPTSFRGGGLCCSTEILKLIKKYGFKVDSSTAAKLDEKKGWYQGHQNVPYKSLYLPSTLSYDKPAMNNNESIGLLEVPVTRMIPSGRGWYPWTLTPASPIWKFIIKEWVAIKKNERNPLVICPIFHSWGEWKLKKKKFKVFIRNLDSMIQFTYKRNFEFLTMNQIYSLVIEKENES